MLVVFWAGHGERTVDGVAELLDAQPISPMEISHSKSSSRTRPAIEFSRRSTGRRRTLSSPALAVTSMPASTMSGHDVSEELDEIEGLTTPSVELAKVAQSLEQNEAVGYALDAYKNAWADGPPFAFQPELDRAARLLDEMGVAPPVLTRTDPADVIAPNEPTIRAFIEDRQRADLADGDD